MPRRVRAVVVVLHGGAARERGVRTSTRATQLSVLRLVPTAWWIAWRTRRHGVAVYRQRNTWRGWDGERGPVEDTLTSLTGLAQRHGPVPTVLVGHSLGGRTALIAGQDDRVGAVVVLNAYVYDTDSPALPDRDVLVVHGDADRVADPARALALADRLEGARVETSTVPGGKHAMLGSVAAFDGAAARFVARWAGRVVG